jgi:hypothetical protein
VRINRQRLGFFVECFPLRVIASQSHTDLHQHSLASSPRTRMSRSCSRRNCGSSRSLGHTTSSF